MYSVSPINHLPRTKGPPKYSTYVVGIVGRDILTGFDTPSGFAAADLRRTGDPD